ncbi:MAG: diguanylate cyclase [Oscillospiraceae bacterium]
MTDEMNEQDIDVLFKQIKEIVLNKPPLPTSEQAKVSSEELRDLQNAISYLADCSAESNEFLRNLSIGNLNVQAPDRHNMMASNLKELQSGLKHLTWQANQVANGDYKQKVSFLGEFSDSFNQMVAQLEERENKLKSKTDALTKSMNLLIAIMDGMRDWVVVTESKTGEVLYINLSAKEHFYNPQNDQLVCLRKSCDLLKHLRTYSTSNDGDEFVFSCNISERDLYARTFSIQWNEKMAYVHFISDVTNERVEKEQLESLAFKDELTGLFNRRYGMQKLDDLVSDKKEFSVCMIDLDGLKRVNDSLGHLSGDDYLITIANAMLEIESPDSVTCRVGGDEFVIIFPNCVEAVAREKVKLLNENIASIKRDYTLSISCGIFYVSSNMNLLPETILERADEKMYIVKKEKKACREQ